MLSLYHGPPNSNHRSGRQFSWYVKTKTRFSFHIHRVHSRAFL